MLAASAAAAQTAATPLPLDQAIRAGTLPNGLTYLIRQNPRPAKQVMLRLAVKAGSIDEADDQRGLAHMLEHMNFNGSAHFKPGELVSYLQSVGAAFGPHVNAYTGYDETVYMLDLPTEHDGVVARGFEALSDFAGGATLDPTEVDKERGVVIEEWRGQQGASMRMLAPQTAALYGKSRYNERLPIGDPDLIRSFPVQRLRDFYRTYYRPDRMAVIVVGDIDPGAAEALIREHFAGLRNPAPATRPVYPVPLHDETRYASVSDPEAQASSVSVIHKRQIEKLRTYGDYRRSIVEGLVRQMLNARLAELARQPNAPFLGASAGGEEVGRTLDAFEVSARVPDGAIGKGLTAVEAEIQRVRRFGFGDGELDRARRGMLAGYERSYNERDKAASGPFASELLRYFLDDEAAPGIETELRLVRQSLPTITAAETGEVARRLLPETNRVVIATSPQRPGISAVSETALRDALRAGADAKVEAWHDSVSGRELMAKAPTPGTIVSRREIPDIGATVLKLSNGAEVWLKPTDFRNDQIIFTSYARGGTSVAPPEQYLDAAFSTSLVGIAGVGGMSPIDLGKLLAGRIANASAYMSDYTHGVRGSSTPKDLETALQLLYLDFTAPNDDPSAFALLKRRLEASIANRAQNPGAVFGDRVRAINTLDHYSTRPLTAEDIAKLDPAREFAFYRREFANAANFTFFFVGAFTVDDLVPLVERYVASLPSKGVADATLGDMKLQFPDLVRRETVNKGREPRSQTVISFFADTKLDEMQTYRLRAAAAVLENRLRDILREDMGGTYSVGVGYSDTSPQPGYGTTSVQFGSAPENVEKLTAAVMTELDRLRKDGPSAADVQAVKETEKTELQTSLRQNGYWLNSLEAVHILGRDPRRIPERIERAEALSVDNIHAAFEKYFPADRYTVITLMPELQNTAAAAPGGAATAAR